MEFDFIHIGMGRSMSTYLQSVFITSNNYRTFKTSSLSNYASNLISQSAGDTEKIAQSLRDVTIDETPFSSIDKSKINVLTDEGLTFSFSATPEMGQYCLLHKNICAQLLAPYTKKVLLIVRDPLDWITSFYAYSVKINRYDKSMLEFLQEYRSVVLGNLNVRELLKFWVGLGVDVSVIPMETNKDNEGDFWSEFSQIFELPKGYKNNFSRVQKNQSDFNSLNLHRNLNFIQNQIFGLLSKHDYQERNILDRSQEEQKWNTRRFFENSDAETIKTLSSLFSKTESSLNFKLDSELCEYLEVNYINSLQEISHKKFTPIYQNYLRNVRSK